MGTAAVSRGRLSGSVGEQVSDLWCCRNLSTAVAMLPSGMLHASKDDQFDIIMSYR